jgi:hypothetical protein
MASCTEGKTEEMEALYRESPPIVGAARKSTYLRPDDSAPFPVTAPLMVLRGTWAGMGEEYGKRAAPEMRQVFEGLFKRLEAVGLDLQSLRDEIESCRASLEQVSPQTLEFMQGIADGSDLELQKSAVGTDLGGLEKIVLINFFPSIYESAPGFGGGLEEEGSAWECRGELTSGGVSLTGASIDASFYPFMYRLALVVIPDDPGSFICFSMPVAGCVGGASGLNDQGLSVTALPVKATASPGAPSETQVGGDAGEQPLPLPPSLLSSLVLLNARDAGSAQEILLHGTSDIAENNGEEGLIPSADSSFLVSDARSTVVVERDRMHYGIRNEEPAGTGGSFIACTDHYSASESYNADGGPSEQPMSAFGPAAPDIVGSFTRLRSLQGLLGGCTEAIDTAWLMANAAGMDYIYDDGGEKSYDVRDALGEVVSCFKSGLTVDRYVADGEFPYFGTVCSTSYDPTSLDIRYELGLPSDWVGPWEHINLGDYQR